MACRELVHALQGLSIRTNSMLEFISPPTYYASQNLRGRLMEKYAWAKDLLENDPLLAQGRSIQFNRMTPSHTDKRGPHGEWTPLVALGFSKGAKIRLAGIKEILLFDPGTIIFIRGGEIPHAIEAWSGGQRISIACFTHEVIWREFDEIYPWSFPREFLVHILKPM